MSRKVSESLKKYIAGTQSYQCANKPGIVIVGLESYNCPLWRETNSSVPGNFDESGYEIDHIIEHCISQDDTAENLQALCKSCHNVKTMRFNRKLNEVMRLKRKINEIVTLKSMSKCKKITQLSNFDDSNDNENESDSDTESKSDNDSDTESKSDNDSDTESKSDNESNEESLENSESDEDFTKYIANILNNNYILYDRQRIMTVVDSDNKVWFAANDIAIVLKYKRPQVMISKLVSSIYKKQFQDITTENKRYSRKYQNKSMFIDELGLIRLLNRSNRLGINKFRTWITDKILPELHKNGIFDLKKKVTILEKQVQKISKRINNQ